MGSLISKLKDKNNFLKCFFDDFPKSLFFLICLPCFKYTAVAAFAPLLLCVFACSLISIMMIGKHVIYNKISDKKDKTITVKQGLNMLNNNKTTDDVKEQLNSYDFSKSGEDDLIDITIDKKSFFKKFFKFLSDNPIVPIVYTILYPILWTLLLSFILRMRKNYLINMYIKNNEPVPDKLKNMTFGDIMKETYKAGIAIAILSVIGYLFYDFTGILIQILSMIPIPPSDIIAMVLGVIRDTATKILTKNGARIGLISTGSGVHALFTMIPILGPLLSTPLVIIPPILIATFLSFTILCKKLGLDEFKFDGNPFVPSNFKDQVSMGFKNPSL